MNRATAEANWIWDPKHGDLRPPEWPKNRRIALTEKNIEAQRALARPCTLIHWLGNPTCERVVKMIDKTEVLGVYEGPRRYHAPLAGYIDNVNCLACRKEYYNS